MHILNNPRIAEKIGFSDSLNERTISAYHDAARYIFHKDKLGTITKRVYMRGWKSGYKTLTEVRQDITTGETLFIKYQGEYEELLQGKILLADFVNSDVA